MKRPIPIYFVASWCLFALILAINGAKSFSQARLPEGESVERTLDLTVGFVTILAFYHVYQLLQLKSFHRWFTVVFFGYQAIVLVVNGANYSAAAESSRVLTVFLGLAFLNLASIWYLLLPSFRKASVQFVAEREREHHSRSMQRAAQKSLEREIRTMRS